MRRNNRVCRVETRLVSGTQAQLNEALFDSEDSSTVNTSFVERLNLTIRQGCSYLSRRSAGHARFAELLDDHMALLQCHYNFIRPHRSLQLGKEKRTPAWQAGLVSRQLTFREIFLHPLAMLLLLFVYVHVAVRVSGRMSVKRLAVWPPTVPARDLSPRMVRSSSEGRVQRRSESDQRRYRVDA